MVKVTDDPMRRMSSPVSVASVAGKFWRYALGIASRMTVSDADGIDAGSDSKLSARSRSCLILSALFGFGFVMLRCHCDS